MCPNRTERIFFYRQWFVLFTILAQSFSNGVFLAFPSILNPAILDPHSTDIRATSSDASWLASILGYAGLVGFFILSPIMQIFGRKNVNIFKNALIAIGWIIFYFAESLTTLYIARTCHGITVGGLYINVIAIAEYTDPDRRGYFTAIQKASVSLGVLFCHSMVFILTWRQISAIAFIPPALAMILTFFWPESPFFLAMKGRYEDCERSFHWLNGTVHRSHELQELLATQKKKVDNEKCENRPMLKRYWELLSRREFIRAFLIVTIVCITIDLCGRNYFKAYIVQIMIDLTGNKTTGVYISLLSDCLVIIALMLSSIVIKRFKRRTLILTGGTLAALILFMISLSLFLKNSCHVNISSWVSPALILLINFVVHVSVSPIGYAIMGEIYPLDVKGIGSCMSGVVFTASFGTVMKLTPVLMESIGLEGEFVIYGSGLVVCLVTLHFILPETKDKTLLEIENKLKGNKGPVTDNDTALLDINYCKNV